MLPQRVDALAPDLPAELRQWFVEPAYGMPSRENQDWDLVLANWDWVPLLAEYAQDPSHPMEKRYDAFLALMVLQGFELEPERGDARQRADVDEQIRRIVLTHPDFARAAARGHFGLVEGLTVLTLLGDPLPADTPQWIRDAVRQRAGTAVRDV